MKSFVNKKVIIPIGSKKFRGTLTIPPRAKAVIIFAHGGGGGRTAPRNNMVARFFNEKNFGTLLFDMLTVKDDSSNKNNLDINLLSKRLTSATKWFIKQPESKGLKIGYFSVSSGTPAAIITAVKMPKLIFAIVSKSGRPDLSPHQINLLRTPILYVVGESDEPIVDINEEMYLRTPSQKDMVVIPEAGHFFDEPGALLQVSKYSLNWFKKYLKSRK